jgi:transcription regulator MmyB-like protein
MAEVNLKLLGDTIRAFREQAQPRKVSQFRLASMLNWEGTAPLIEIEKGRRHPRPETLNALGEALQLSQADIAYLHGLAGYRQITALPPLEQIIRVLEGLEPDIERRPYPVYVMDYRFRFWMFNSASAAFHGGSLDRLTTMMKAGVDCLRMVFDSRLAGPRFSSRESLERESVFRFKDYNLYRRHEPFFQAYPDCMRDSLLPEDYERFLQRWNEIDARTPEVYPVLPQLVEQASAALRFDVHIVEIPHLDRTLFAAYYEPKDDETGNRERCDAFFGQHSPKDRQCIRAWDFQENVATPLVGLRDN